MYRQHLTEMANRPSGAELAGDQLEASDLEIDLRSLNEDADLAELQSPY